GEDAARAGAVPRLIQKKTPIRVCCVVGRPIFLDEVPLEIAEHACRPRRMVWIVTGIDVRNARSSRIRKLYRCTCRCKLLELIPEMPCETGSGFAFVRVLILKLAVGLFERKWTAAGVGFHLIRITLRQIRFYEQDRGLVDAECSRDASMRGIPWVKVEI